MKGINFIRCFWCYFNVLTAWKNSWILQHHSYCIYLHNMYILVRERTMTPLRILWDYDFVLGWTMGITEIGTLLSLEAATRNVEKRCS